VSSEVTTGIVSNHRMGIHALTGGLSCRHGFRRTHGQLQRFAQGSQVCIPWTNAIVLPEVNAGLTDTNLFGNFGNG
jgi:hypothetical protein